MTVDDILRAGGAKHQAGDLDGAEAAYRQILDIDPNHFDAQHLLGVLRLQQGRAAEAVPLIERAVAVNATVAGAFANLGVAYLHLDRGADALHAYDRARALAPADPATLEGRGEALLKLGRAEEALTSFADALRLSARAPALKGKAMALSSLQRHDEALAAWRSVPSASADVLANIGFSLIALDRYDEAEAALKQALAIVPTFAPALRSLLIVLVRRKTLANELAIFAQAVALAPQDPEVHRAHGLALRALGRPAEALAAFERARALDPQHLCALAESVYGRRFACDWQAGDPSDLVRLAERIRAGNPIEPYMGLLLFDDPALQQQNTRAYMAPQAQPPAQPPAVCKTTAYGHAKPRIAYVSADFRDHPVAVQVADLLARHDRDAFDIFGISYGSDDGSALRARLSAQLGGLVDAQAMTDHDVAAWLAAREIDIAVDLTGHTGIGRMGIFAHRGAPIQVSYLGYPGTNGVPYFDYVIADDFIIPADEHVHYDEKVVTLPDTYQVTDATRPRAAKALSRADAGLPAQGFVFSCFNAVNKITPEIFDLWMRLLKQVPGSVLWLRCDRADAKENLRNAAQKRGVDAARLIFAARAPEDQHLARQLCADLFLDTTGYNAHATGTEALWTGTPLITCAGRSYAARAAGSHLRAAGLSELITSSLSDYEALALKLATDPAYLAEVRARVSASWTQSALFDTARFTRHLEAAYRTMIGIAQSGERPRAFAIPPQP